MKPTINVYSGIFLGFCLTLTFAAFSPDPFAQVLSGVMGAAVVWGVAYGVSRWLTRREEKFKVRGPGGPQWH